MPTGSEFSRVDFGKQQDVYAAKYQQSATGEFDPQAPGNVPVEQLPGTDGNQFYGTEPINRQFSSKMSGDPRELARQADQSVQAHADLNRAYGLGQPIAGVGIHPWLRDGLATPDQGEPGNAEPNSKRGYPMDPNKGD